MLIADAGNTAGRPPASSRELKLLLQRIFLIWWYAGPSSAYCRSGQHRWEACGLQSRAEAASTACFSMYYQAADATPASAAFSFPKAETSGLDPHLIALEAHFPGAQLHAVVLQALAVFEAEVLLVDR